MDNRQQSLQIARIRGIGIFVHYSWLLIAALILLSFWGQVESLHPSLNTPSTLALSALGTGVFFGSVLVHELAHALVARRRGIDVKGITLFLFGGATEADASSRSAGDEFVVAIVGPLTSLAAGAVLGLVAMATAGQGQPLSDLFGQLAAINVLLALFNLAPGLPLDGGRVFRSIAWGATGDFAKATRWATAAGVALGYLLVSVGLLSLWQGSLGGLWLVAIGWMISQSARQNEYQEELRAEFKDLVAADLMSSPVIVIPAETSIANAVRDYFSQHTQTTFPVVDGDRICGLLSVSAVRKVPAGEIWKTTAGRVALAEPAVSIVDRHTPMVEVIEALASRSEAKSRVLVVDNGYLAGIISPSDIVRRHSIADLVQPALTASMRR